jgi:DtxR family Mn-dependent transcriptional regulator
MVQRMAANDPPLIEYHKHHGVKLTIEGRQAALEVIRHHRLLESYLVKSLGYPWHAVHEEACQLEHVISEELEQRIAESLGHPLRDPHGDPIPSADLVMPPTQEVALSSLEDGAQATVRRVRGDDPAFLRHLDELGLIPGSRLTVRAHSPFDGNLTVAVASREVAVIGTAISDNVFVEVA